MIQLGLQTPISKTKRNREQLKSLRGALSLVRTSPFLSHLKDWSMRAQLARLRREVAVQLSESPPPPFFSTGPHFTSGWYRQTLETADCGPREIFPSVSQVSPSRAADSWR